MVENLNVFLVSSKIINSNCENNLKETMYV